MPAGPRAVELMAPAEPLIVEPSCRSVTRVLAIVVVSRTVPGGLRSTGPPTHARVIHMTVHSLWRQRVQPPRPPLDAGAAVPLGWRCDGGTWRCSLASRHAGGNQEKDDPRRWRRRGTGTDVGTVIDGAVRS